MTTQSRAAVAAFERSLRAFAGWACTGANSDAARAAVLAEFARLVDLLAEYESNRRGRCDWCGSKGEHEDTCPTFTPTGEVR